MSYNTFQTHLVQTGHLHALGGWGQRLQHLSNSSKALQVNLAGQEALKITTKVTKNIC
jgi:hypothetical protein